MLLTDLYQISMACGYIEKGMHFKPAQFDYFFREGEAVFCGVETLQRVFDNILPDSIDLYEINKMVYPEVTKRLRDLVPPKIMTVTEGSRVKANEVLVRVTGGLASCQLFESPLLNILNQQTAVATRAAEYRAAAGDDVLIEMGMRRANGQGAPEASYAAIVGGFNGTSNVQAAYDYSLALYGTMAHSWVLSFDSEPEAFKAALEVGTEILLIDTYDSIQGIKNASIAFKEAGTKRGGVRIDSGDFVELSKFAASELSWLDNYSIIVSGDVTPEIIKFCKESKAPISGWGVGTKLVDTVFGGVYKLTELDGKPKQKNSPGKSANPVITQELYNLCEE